MKKIVFISSYLLSGQSAEIIYIMEMCNAFSKNGFKITLCVPKFDLSKELLFERYGIEYPFKIIEINIPKIVKRGIIPGRSIIFSILASNKLGRMINTMIYSRDPWTFIILSVLYKRRCFCEVHQFRFMGSLQTFIYRTLVKYGTSLGNGRIVCISKTLMKQWHGVNVENTKMFVAHDAVNITKFSTVMSKTEARMKLGINKQLSIIMYTGSLIPSKGVDILIKCANRLPDLSFFIVGGEEEQIKKLIQFVKYSNVEFVGQVPPIEVPIYQAAADILCLPNTKGSVIDDVTSPMKLFEYMASERPIVATDMPSLLEILKHKYNALISPAGDDYKLSANIKLIKQNPDLSKLLVKNACQNLMKHTWDARIQYLTKLFDESNYSTF